MKIKKNPKIKEPKGAAKDRRVTANKRGARAAIGEPGRGRKRGPHKTKTEALADEAWLDEYDLDDFVWEDD